MCFQLDCAVPVIFKRRSSSLYNCSDRSYSYPTHKNLGLWHAASVSIWLHFVHCLQMNHTHCIFADRFVFSDWCVPLEDKYVGRQFRVTTFILIDVGDEHVKIAVTCLSVNVVNPTCQLSFITPLTKNHCTWTSTILDWERCVGNHFISLFLLEVEKCTTGWAGLCRCCQGVGVALNCIRCSGCIWLFLGHYWVRSGCCSSGFL